MNPQPDKETLAAQARLEKRRKEVRVTTGAAKETASPAGLLAEQILIDARPLFPEDAEARRKEKDSEVALARIERVSVLFARSRVPERHKTRASTRSGRFEKWAVKESDLRMAILQPRGSTNMLIGLRGNGKTQMAVEAVRFASGRLKSSLFVTAEHFFVDLKASYKHAIKTERDVIDDYRKPRLLVLDEMDGTKWDDWENQKFVELMNCRYGDMTDTILIANWTLAEFEKVVSAKVRSRIKETGRIVNCDWPSFR